MDLLSNAVQSIQVGVEDYSEGSHPRLLSAVRNIHAGILLLYKEALRRKSPKDSNEVLIKTHIVPKLVDGELVFHGDGKKTVTLQEIRERLAGLGVSVDWKRLQQITDVRNELEHYYPSATRQTLRGVIANAFVLIRDFLTEELQEDPLETLGEGTWQEMLQEADVHVKELQACKKLLENIAGIHDSVKPGLESISCDACGSDLMKPEIGNDEGGLVCSSCGATQSTDIYVPKALAAAGVFTATCPECANESYMYHEAECAICQCKVDHDCERCGGEILPEELDQAPLCGYCAHMFQKLQDE